MEQLHIVSPTLQGQAGHEYGYVVSLLQANVDFDIHVWCDRRVGDLLEAFNCTVHPYFVRQLRKPQLYFCYKKLIKAGRVILTTTSGQIDLQMSASFPSCNPQFFHFHQYNPKSKKLRKLKGIAKSCPRFVVLTTTPSLKKIFVDAGFKQTHVLPCHNYSPQKNIKPSGSDHAIKLLYAGAARADKGFPQVVDVVGICRDKNRQDHFVLQVSAPESGKYDNPSLKALTQLESLSYPNLTTHRQTLNKDEYLTLFEHAITLLLYEQGDYQNKYSGVAHNAFSAGSPVITTPNTWAAQMVQRYQAGKVVAPSCPQAVLEAIDEIKHNLNTFQEGAQRAGAEIDSHHDPMKTLQLIRGALA